MFVKFDENGDGVLTLDEFTELIHTLEPEKDELFIVTMFRKALDLEGDEENMDFMSPQSFCELAIKENLGGYGKNKFEEIEIHTELLEVAMQSAQGKKGKTGTIFGNLKNLNLNKNSPKKEGEASPDEGAKKEGGSIWDKIVLNK